MAAKKKGNLRLSRGAIRRLGEVLDGGRPLGEQTPPEEPKAKKDDEDEAPASWGTWVGSNPG